MGTAVEDEIIIPTSGGYDSRETVGTASLSSSRYLPPISGPTSMVNPVAFAPGRAKLLMRPSPLGYLPSQLLHDLADDELRRLVLGQEEAPEVFADQPEHDQLNAGEYQDRDEDRSPADRDTWAHEPLDDDGDPEDQADTARGHAEQRAQSQRRHREVHEHVEPESDELSHGVGGATVPALGVGRGEHANVPGAAQHEPVDVGIRPAVFQDFLHREPGQALEAR